MKMKVCYPKLTNKWLSITIIVSIIANWIWLIPAYLTSGDWWFLNINNFIDFVRYSPIWLNENFGFPSGTPQYYAIRFIEGMASLLGGFNFAANEKLFYFFPIVFIAPLGSFLLCRRYVKSPFAAIGAIVYSFNTTFLFLHAGPLTIGAATAIAPLFLYLFLKYIDGRQSFARLILLTLLFNTIVFYEIRISLLIAITGLVLYLAKTNGIDQRWISATKGLFVFAVVTIFIQLFWLLPYTIGHNATEVGRLAGRSIYYSYVALANAITLFHPFWTGARPATFIPQPIPFYAWLLPLVAFSTIFINRHSKNKSEIFCWTSISLIGIILVKQDVAPIAGIYSWLYQNIPAFGMFRESTKLFTFVSLGYSILIPIAIQTLIMPIAKSAPVRLTLRSGLGFLFAFGVVIITLINTLPLINGSFKTLYTPHNIPEQYSTINKIISSDKGFGRVFWLPSKQRFGYYSQDHPRVSAESLEETTWKNLNTEKYRYFSYLDEPYFESLMNYGSIKYIIVPPDTQKEIYQHYGGVGPEYYYQKIISRLNLNLQGVFKNTWINHAAKPRIYLANDVTIAHTGASNFSGIDRQLYSATVFTDDLNTSQIKEIEGLSNSSEYYLSSLDNLLINSKQIDTTFFENRNLRNDSYQIYTYFPRSSSYEIYAEWQADELLISALNTFNTDIKFDIAKISDIKLIAPETLSIRINSSTYTINKNVANQKNIIGSFIPEDEDNQIVVAANDGEESAVLFHKNFNPVVPAATMKTKKFDSSQSARLTSSLVEGKNLVNRDLVSTNVGDCNNYNKTSLEQNEVIGKLTEEEANALQVSVGAGGHIACFTAPVENFDKNYDYFVKFHYKHSEGPSPMISMYPRITEPTNELQVIDSTTTSSSWKSFQYIFKSGNFSDQAVLYFYVPSTRKGASTSEFKDIEVYKLPRLPKQFLRLDLPPSSSISELDSSTLSPTLHTGKVSKLVDRRLLVFSDEYSSNWKLFLSDNNSPNQSFFDRLFFNTPGYEINSKNHIVANGSYNGWYIDPSELPESFRNSDGNYKITLEYWPQRWFYLGLLISGTTLLACFGYLGFIGVRKFRNRNNPPVSSYEIDSGAAQQAAVVASNVNDNQVGVSLMQVPDRVRNDEGEMIEGGFSRKNATMIRLAQFTQDRWSVKGALSRFKNVKKLDEK